MLKKLTIIFLLMSNFAFAQTGRYPTPFDTFIVNRNIEWAGYANCYLDSLKINLNKILFTRFTNAEIKASEPGYNYSGYLTKDSLDKKVLYPQPHYSMPIYDSSGNIILILPDFAPYEIDTTALRSLYATQILYIENGVLKSYVPWVSPLIVKVTTVQTKILVGYSDYFSTCYNYQSDYLPEKNEILYLGEANRKLSLDTIEHDYYPIKELYRKNILETLLPNGLTEDLYVSTFDSDTKIEAESINDSILSRINTVLENVNYQDSFGNFIPTQYPFPFFEFNDFTEIQLVQGWYYNFTENIVFNKIKELYLCAKKWTKKGEDKEASPILKIVFK
jgi:hypothetical protein